MATRYLIPVKFLGNAAILSAAVFLASCAAHPDRIKPVSYADATCTDADRQRLADLIQVQKATARNDAVGVFLIGLPMGRIAGGNHAPEIARLKGACS
ncbi:hypothetical protein [Chelativorans xinjiangense]|uniref:hypothetical protein n=1 Tax=Chelativorans xinjiangense TaxID=2681485 RepID=UPI00135C50E6|nr:hypothetical protein [Chelativorans xinjiangense]